MLILLLILVLTMFGAVMGIVVAGRSYKSPELTKYIREKDAIRQWGISKATFIRARKKGLKFVRLGAYVCYRPEDLEAFFCQPRSWQALMPTGEEGNCDD